MADLAEIVSKFGTSAKGKLANAAVAGAPEDQLRAPLETLVLQLAELAGHRRNAVKLVGETTLALVSKGDADVQTLARRDICYLVGQWPGSTWERRNLLSVPRGSLKW
jgi:hypothetical protein